MRTFVWYIFLVFVYAGVAKLADALDLGSSVYDVGVQVPSPAPNGNLVELWLSLLMGIDSRNGIVFCCVKEIDDLLLEKLKRK